MATLVMGAIGAAALGPIGMGVMSASMGFSIGAVVGGYLFAPKMPDQFGPRLGDLKVQTSTYGNPIPLIYGAMRVSGNMIWSTDIVETSHTTESSGGKGGPSVSTTNYTYSQSFAVALCEGQIAGVSKIWANGKLIYNLNNDSDSASVAASNGAAINMRIYTGSEAQTADSLIQADIGASDTPSYRGIAYVVFENLQLADFGNRTPNLEFEVMSSWTISNPAGSYTSYATTSASPVGCAFDNVTNSIWVCNSTSATVSKFNIFTGTKVDYATGTNPQAVAFDSVTNSMWVCNANAATVSKINIFTGTKVDYATGNNPNGIAFDRVTKSMWVTNWGSTTVSKINIYTGTRANYTVGNNPYGVAFDSVTNSIWVANNASATVSKVNIFTGAVVNYAAGVNPYGVAFDSVTNSIWVANSGANTVSKFNISTGTKVDYATGTAPQQVVFESITNSIWVTNYSSAAISKLNPSTGAKTDYAFGTNPLGISFDSMTNSLWITRGGQTSVCKTNIQDWGFIRSAIALSSIVSSICTRTGLTSGQIDVTALTDSVTGYLVQRSTARAQLEQLMRAFYFDAVESDGKIKFVKRGGASAASITEDDLAARDYSSSNPDTLVIGRKQDMELPSEVSVQYIDEASSYQIGAQRSQRVSTNSKNQTATNFAIAMSATKAKQIADVLMYDAWSGRTTFTQSHSWEYSYLEPTDIITVTKDGRSYVMRIIDEDYSGGIYNRQAVMEDSSVYTQSATASSLIAQNTVVSSTPMINLMLLDIPLLRDQDDGVGYYASACGYSSGWTGAQSFKSNDGGATWTSFGNAILNAASIGVAQTALGDFTQNIFDETSNVTIVMISGTLSSDTELNVLNGSNVALIGNEIIQFRDATLTATNTYTLTGFLRGRFGTEWAAPTHAIGDRFVLLNATTTYLFSGSSTEYNLARKYRGVSFGGFLDDAPTVDFTNTAIAQMPYAPVQLGGGRNAAGDLTLNWIRRTRISGGWNDGSDVPLGESTEAYVVEIYTNSAYTTLKRTISGLTTATTTYTSAQQVTDFGGNQSTVYWKVCQVSATIGNGYKASGVT